MPLLRLQVAIAIIERRGRCLICRRRAWDSYGGLWEFPGGKRRAGEVWAACLRREVREELGVAVTRLREWGGWRFRDEAGTVSFRVFRCAIGRATPKPLAAQALRWVPWARLARYRFPPANRRLIAWLRGAPGCYNRTGSR